MGADSRRNEGMGPASIGTYRHLDGNGGGGYRHLPAAIINGEPDDYIGDGNQVSLPPVAWESGGDKA